MIRPLTAPRSTARKPAKAHVFLGLRALVAFLVASLQLSSALHFTLVPHTFSAALGGVVHVHGVGTRGRARAEPPAIARAAQPTVITTDALSCAVDRCPFADAPHASPACLAARVSGVAAFGAPALLNEAVARSPNTGRVFPSAPKTSPPV